MSERSVTTVRNRGSFVYNENTLGVINYVSPLFHMAS